MVGASHYMFRDREEAGQKLARALKDYRDRDVVIYALPRGGVILGSVISKNLGVPLELIISRKISHPFNPEYAIGAVTESGSPVLNKEELTLVDALWLKRKIAEERAEAKRRQETYLAGRTSISAKGKIAIIVDDGAATGLTLLSAIRKIRKYRAEKVVIAVPVMPKDTANKLKNKVNECVVLADPKHFLGAVGAYYRDFPQVTDEEVIELLRP